MENKRNLEILVVEDNEKHLNDAKEFFKNKTGVNITYVSLLSEAQKALFGKEIYGYNPKEFKQLKDGVIIDIYFPNDMLKRHREYPTGVLLAARCHVQKIPFVFNTSGYHHGSKYQFVHDLVLAMNWPAIVDAAYSDDDPDIEVDTKKWEEAYNKLCSIIFENKTK